jgi:hypothetical protein
MNGRIQSIFLLGFGLLACDDTDLLSGSDRHDVPTSNGDAGSTRAALTCFETSRSYVLFDGTKLEASRTTDEAAMNRARIKPFSVMGTEYQRVLGFAPAAMKDAANSFESTPPRWFYESSYSGVSLDAISTLSFDACLEYVASEPTFDAMPTRDSAGAACTDWMHSAWNRSPSPEEIAGCAELAMTGVASETDVRKRWAYTCASVLSSSQFLTY